MAPKFYEAPKFYPTHRDMAGPFEKYIESIEDELAEFGLGIIIPPRGWKPTSAKYETMNFDVPKPIRQHVTGSKGIYQSVHVEQKGISLQDFKAMANLKENMAPIQVDTLGPEHDDLERHFWKNVTHFPPLYGADSEGSLFDPDHKGWNIRDLDTCLSKTLKEHGASLPGVTTPYLYVGMWRSMFAWHTEDVDLYSVNYLHFGEPKSWYCIPPALRGRFERVVEGLMPEFHRNCPEFLRHKETLVTPFLIQQHNIPLVKAVQTPGQWIINFPSAYHSGFNHGFNCAESTNFATRRWVEYGAKAKACKCSGESVRIDMRLFGVEPPPVKIKPGALLLAPPLPPPDLSAATLPLVAQGKMVRRKALLPEGTTGVSPEKAAKGTPSKASSPAGPGSPPKKRKPAGEAPKRSHKKQKGVQGTPVAAPAAPGGVLLAPGLEPLPVVPPAKKRKAAGGSVSPPKKGGAAAALELAPLAVGAELAQAGGAGGSRKGSKPKASKAKKGTGAQVAPSEAPSLPAAPNAVAASPGGLAKKVSQPKQKAEKGGAKKQKGKLATAPLAPVAPVIALENPPLTGLGGVTPLAVAVQAPPRPKKSKGKGAKSAAVGGSAVASAAVHPGAAKGKVQPLVAASGPVPKTHVPKILRIKFNPPAALAVAPGGAGSKGAKAPGSAAETKKSLPLGGGASPPAKVGGLEATPLPQPDSAGGSDRVRTRRGGGVEEPLAVLFKDPPTGTKLQGRKRVREGREGQALGKGEGQSKSGDAPTSSKKKKKGGRKEGGQKGAPVGVGADGVTELNGAAAGGLGQANFAGVQAGSFVAGEPASAAEGVPSAAPAPGSVEDACRAASPAGPSTVLPVEAVAVREVTGGVQPIGEEAVNRSEEVGECGPPSHESSEAQLASASAQREGAPVAVEVTATELGGVTRNAGFSEAAPPAGVLGSSLVAPSVDPGGEVTVAAAVGAEGAAPLGAGAPGLLPKLVSPKQKKGKKKAGSRKGAVNALPGSSVPSAGGAAASKPRQRRRGPPPVERPSTHQMSRRSRQGASTPGEAPQTAQKVSISNPAEELATGVATDETFLKVETGDTKGFEGPASKSKPPVEMALASGDEPLCAPPEKVELLIAPAERLKGGAAPEVSGAVSGGSQSQGQAGARSRSGSEKSGRLVMRVEGSRLLLRRVKQTEGPEAVEPEKELKRGPVAADRGDEAPQKSSRGGLPGPVAQALGVCVNEGIGRPLEATGASAAPTDRCLEEPRFAHKLEPCNELVLSEVTVLTNCDPEADAPAECARATLGPAPKAGRAEEALDTSSQDSLSLTYHGDGHEVNL
ncbi:protein with JUMONJI domain [Klebsormidium nitens]|uniref:Protein with JUMONJI domain n=1 Tax=Klebsormidium nitens TaxID=105231 RepID=A0A1Y1HS13_KLENI|nr:protein with JUMONJI domain [Klebsormidium nitens]|eukprot:GAQ81425.1 protein with JUMONJI domain [Klebsormidium nitens]